MMNEHLMLDWLQIPLRTWLLCFLCFLCPLADLLAVFASFLSSLLEWAAMTTEAWLVLLSLMIGTCCGL